MTSDTSDILFVGGAPRSGTTVLHALLCTSARTCRYHPEVSFIRPLVETYVHGLSTWDAHTHAFFEKKAHFHHHMRRMTSWAFDHVSTVLKNPQLLCVKDPCMTPFFGALREIMGQRIRTVTSVRHPYDVLRSRQTVIERHGQGMTEAMADKLAREYVTMYRHLDDPRLEGCSLVLRYEDLEQPETLERLRVFTGLDDLSPDEIWAETRARSSDADQSAWGSPKYHAALDLRPRHTPLDPRWRDIARPICGPLMAQFGYDPA
ncbi:sulfotransferase family protein [Halodurantibacterium flavum]|uniref:Sulfotransferase family protein n=1 Tax=Halodurantibacterium flavum TaxID=1382802 RepID=A0ABW4S6D8_9RHOB